jgi:hypothetical protein
MNPSTLVSPAFQAFMKEAPAHAQAWGAMIPGLAGASALDKKTSALAYLATNFLYALFYAIRRKRFDGKTCCERLRN